MGKFIIKITDPKDNTDYYMEWSTIVDAPVTAGMSLKEFKKYYMNEYKGQSPTSLKNRLKRVALCGSSGFPPYDNVENFISNNWAGENEHCLNLEGILNVYCRK